MTDPLSTWNAGAVKDAILGYVDQITSDGSPDLIPVEERVAVFDNDGTLWCEKPMPIQLDFVLRRLAEMAQLDPSLRDKQPWKAAHERDYAWLARGHGRALRRGRHERQDTGEPAWSPPSRTSASTSSRPPPTPSCATPGIRR